jgi:4-hydroxy-tetrahydrodipicolinate reductase
MDIILVGYGQMGKMINSICLNRGHTIVARVDPVGGDAGLLTKDLAEKAECVIDFSHPSVVLKNIKDYCNFSLNAVIGTTGWHDHVEQVKAQVMKAGISFIYGSNYSIGAHIFFRLVAAASRIINTIPGYDILGYELHHKKKKDSPSGTAHTIANIILENNKNKSCLVTDKLNRQIEKGELHFASVRGGNIPGIHTVLLDSEADTIELKHSARNRGGFALGAVLAAEWLSGKKGFYHVDDFIKETL